MKVSVSVLSCYDKLIDAVNKVNDTSTDFLHIDVMDGVFVKNNKFPIEIVKKIKEISTKPLDVHLMVNDAETVKKYATIKPEYLTFHVEIINNRELINYVKSSGIKVGLAINPETNVLRLMPFINEIDLILFMSVTPGNAGQTFNEGVIEKIKIIKQCINENVIISIDGGVNDETIKQCKDAGCDMVVAGSFITNSDNYESKIKALR